MKSWLRRVTLSLIVIMVLGGIIVYQLFRNEVSLPEQISENEAGKIELEIKNKQIYMNIYLDNPMSCKDVLKELDIGDIKFGDKNYSPVCTIIDDHHLKIKYEETIAI